MDFIMPSIKVTHSGTEANSTAISNREVRQYLISLGILDYDNDTPGWIDDIISGATSQVGGSARIGRSRLFHMLLALDEISTATVAQLLNRKRLALGDKPYGDRHCRKVAAALRCASGGISHHKGKYHVEPEPKIKECQPLPYTEQEMRELKRLSLQGPFSSVAAYEAELKAKYNLL